MKAQLRALLVPAALAVMATVAAADPFLDAQGPPLHGTTPTSSFTFTGDLGDLTGDLVLDDLKVTALEHHDGTLQNLSTIGGDAVLGASVRLEASFDNGVLDGSKASLLKVSEGAHTYFESSIFSGSIQLIEFSNGFKLVFTQGYTEDAPFADAGDSTWIEENVENDPENFGLLYFFTGHVTNVDDDEGVASLNNLSGKLTPNPEPGTLVLFGACALAGVALRRRRKNRVEA